MKLRSKFFIGLFLLFFVQTELLADTILISSSRANAVRIKVPSLKSSGSGFFIDEKHVVTAFHVVGRVNTEKSKGPTEPPEAHITTGSDISVTLSTGEIISAQIVAPRLETKSIKLVNPLPPSTKLAIFPILTDFAILKLQRKPQDISRP